MDLTHARIREGNWFIRKLMAAKMVLTAIMPKTHPRGAIQHTSPVPKEGWLYRQHTISQASTGVCTARAGSSSRAGRCTTPPPAVTAIVIYLRWRSGGKLSVTQRELENGFCPSRQLGWGVCNTKRIPFPSIFRCKAVELGSCCPHHASSSPGQPSCMSSVVGRRSSGSLRHTKDNSDRLDRRTGLGLRPTCRAGQSLPPRAAGRRCTPILARQAPIRGYTWKPPGFLCRQVHDAVRPDVEGHLGHVLPMDPPKPSAAKRIRGRATQSTNSMEQAVVIASHSLPALSRR